jgi:hypothetical protein
MRDYVDIAERSGRPYAGRKADKRPAKLRSVFGDVSFANLV